MFIREAFELWLNAEPRWSATARRHATALVRLEKLGLARVADAVREKVAAVQFELLRRGWTADSVRSEMNAIRVVLGLLDDRGLLPVGQLAEVRKAALKRGRREKRRRVRFLSRPEFDTLADGAAEIMPRLELPIRVAALAGPRVGELSRMRGEDRLPNGHAIAIETLPEWGEAGSCKTGPRTVPVCQELRELLDTRLPSKGWLFPSMKCWRTDQLARPFMSRATLERGLRALRRRLGMADDITWTVLRHTRASWWLQGSGEQGGASIYKVADWLGHSVLTCESYYGSLVDGYDPECERQPAA